MISKKFFLLPIALLLAATAEAIAVEAVAPTTKELARRLLAHDSFDIYLVPKEHNIIADDDKMFTGWKSHFTKDGAVVELSHAGTDHNTIHEYDTHVPLIFWGPAHCQAGRSRQRVALAQVAPTLGKLLGVGMEPMAYAPPLEACTKSTAQQPQAVLLLVIDQGGWFTLQQNAGQWPNIAKMMAEGFSFESAYTDYGGSGTSASHASLGTGTFPRDNGIFNNDPYYPGLDKVAEVYTGPVGVEPSQLLRATLMDRFLATYKDHAVTLSYSAASRAAIGMAGHGATYRGGGKSQVFWFDNKKKEFTSDEALFRQPEASKGVPFGQEAFQQRRQGIWAQQDCHGRDGKVFAKCMLGSPAFAQVEGNVLDKALLEQKARFEQEGTKGLVMLSLKGVDYCGHYLGQESLECRATLSETDRQIGRLVATMREMTHGNMVAVVTADHGVAPLTLFSHGSMVLDSGLTATLNGRFSGAKKQYAPIKQVSNNAVKLDQSELKAAGYEVKDVVKFLKDFRADDRLFFREVLSLEDLR